MTIDLWACSYQIYSVLDQAFLLIQGNSSDSLLHCFTINIKVSLSVSFPSIISLSLFHPLCHSLFPLFKQFLFILAGESDEQSACGLYPSVSVLNKVVHSAVKPLGWAVSLRTWERAADEPTLIHTPVSPQSVICSCVDQM